MPVPPRNPVGPDSATLGEWKHFLVVDDNGDSIPLELNPGEHVLRLTLLARKLNLDYFLLLPTKE